MTRRKEYVLVINLKKYNSITIYKNYKKITKKKKPV